MNVRYYHEKAMCGGAALAAAHGLGPDDCAAFGGVFELRETFTRHYREQLVGARLEVVGGVLGVQGDGLRFYLELRNPERDERAATYVHEWRLRDAATRAPLPLPENVAQSAGATLVAWPGHGRPRTLDLDRVPAAPPLDEARRRGLAMRKERVIPAEACDAHGFHRASDHQDLFWAGEPARQGRFGPFLHDLPDGGQLGWATLESRAVWSELPRVGTRIQSFGAEVDLTGKVTTRHMWAYDVERGTPLATSSIVNLAFDVTRRRAVEIPPDVRATYEAQLQPDLR
jgi:acyl-CoA thioesterase FadM